NDRDLQVALGIAQYRTGNHAAAARTLSPFGPYSAPDRRDRDLRVALAQASGLDLNSTARSRTRLGVLYWGMAAFRRGDREGCARSLSLYIEIVSSDQTPARPPTEADRRSSQRPIDSRRKPSTLSSTRETSGSAARQHDARS